MIHSTISKWTDYQLIDSGSYEKLERFGDYLLIRPEKSAAWEKSIDKTEWVHLAHAKYHEINFNTGKWEKFKPMPDNWMINYRIGEGDYKIILKLRASRHIGIFPEQETNWNLISKMTGKGGSGMKILNLFAYTGVSSLVSRAGCAQVTHIDSLKQVVSWAKENMTASGLDNIRYLIDDSVRFIKKEIKRTRLYNGIIMDPPTYGTGVKGERWLIKKDIEHLLSLVNQIIDKEKFFLILNLYSPIVEKNYISNIIKINLPFIKRLDIEEVYLSDKFQKKLAAGTVFRAENIT